MLVTVPVSPAVIAVPEILVLSIAAEALMSALRIVPSSNIVEVTVPVSPVVTKVPSIFGIVTIRSAVGSATVKVVSKLSAVAPSKTICESLRVKLLIVGVAIVGLVPNTNAPEPVSSVIVDARLALDGTARKVATPLPRPTTPVEIGNPVALVHIPADGVPSAGVTRLAEVRVGVVANTKEPEPVSSEIIPAN